MPQPVRVSLYSDLGCPFAYLLVFRLRQLENEYRDRLVIERKSLSLEFVNREPTPMRVLENELPLVMFNEPEIPYEPWHAPASEWPVTIWPAFEAVKCAERQGLEAAAELDWLIRRAFFAESRCISMRHVLLELAEEAGLDRQRFQEDFDSGVAKGQVAQEANAGWHELKVPGSPTLVLPSGEMLSDLGLPDVQLDGERNQRVVGFEPATCQGSACLDLLRTVLDGVIAAA